MKIPLFSKLTAKSRGRKVVRASARAMRGGEDEYYEAEPNMKLSHAFMVVLILHVVAVGGIYAFNQIKVNKKPDLLATLSSKISEVSSTAASALPAPEARTTPAELRRMPGDVDEPLPVVNGAVPMEAPAPAATAPKVASAPAAPAVTQNPPPKAAPKPAVETKAAARPTTPSTAGAATYKVAKGDNPYTIAKKLGVTSADLLKLNGIEDPTKLQIGQVLKVPGKAN
jgi:LysM repeat protein